ncbi:hypothetical protein CLPUN_04410 [Clostridium puniceum]|uniref:Uncharacterized protein n=1 Tax=Clostridium puniceum TaxID=29367 RepID=A0A1S8TWV0_9CLOT|nr:hypothetical protein [Clostridium puniceum]OOM82181.1 hypothetical protein CLPUN_04410 [Clostridium puniceum]
MKEVKAKVYYEIATGNILLITPEGQGGLMETTKEQDINIYPELKDKNIHDIEFIELEFGTLESIFINIKSYHVDVATKQLKVDYYTQEEIDEMTNNIPLSAEQLLEQDNANLLLELVQKDILIGQLQGGV